MAALNWGEHWEQARIRGDVPRNSKFEDASLDWAIDTLYDAGVDPSDSESEDVQRAQTYLQLAAFYVHGLVDGGEERERVHQSKVRIIKKDHPDESRMEALARIVTHRIRTAIRTHGELWMNDYLTFLDLNHADTEFKEELNRMSTEDLFTAWLQYIEATKENMEADAEKASLILTNEHAESVLLEWFPNHSENSLLGLYAFARKYRLNVTVEGSPSTVTTGGYPIRLSGPQYKVYQAIQSQWCSNEEPGTLHEHLYIMYMMGDAEAGKRWTAANPDTNRPVHVRFPKEESKHW